MENYSDDNCTCKGQEIDPECFRHKHLLQESSDNKCKYCGGNGCTLCGW